MAWIGVALSAFETFIFFLSIVRYANRWNPYSVEFCDLYLLKHMLPDGHPFGFMYKGLPRNRDYPRLFWPCVATFASTGLVVASAVLAGALGARGLLDDKSADTAFFLATFGSPFGIQLALMAIPAVQNNVCFRREMKGGFGKDFDMHAEIEKKWPGFFGTKK